MSLGSNCGPTLLAMLVLGTGMPSRSHVYWCPPRMCSWSCVTTALGTKSVTMASELALSAPGVCEMSSRATSVVEAADAACGPSLTSLTSTDANTASTAMGKCNSRVVSDSTVAFCFWTANPGAWTSTTYCPAGPAVSVNWQSESPVKERCQAGYGA